MDRVNVIVVQVHVPQGHVVEKTIRQMTVEKIVEISRSRRPVRYPDCRDCQLRLARLLQWKQWRLPRLEQQRTVWLYIKECEFLRPF